MRYAILIFTLKLRDPPTKLPPNPPKNKISTPSLLAKTFLKFLLPPQVGEGVHTMWLFMNINYKMTF